MADNIIDDNTILYESELDSKTGEVINAKMLKIKPKYNPYPEGGFYFQSQQFMLDLALNPDFNLSKEEIRILFYCLGKMDYENYLLFSQVSVAEELGMKKQQVNRGINKLIEKGFMDKIEKIGLCYVYKVNIEFSWKGKTTNLMKERENQLNFIEDVVTGLKINVDRKYEPKLKVVNGGLG